MSHRTVVCATLPGTLSFVVSPFVPETQQLQTTMQAFMREKKLLLASRYFVACRSQPCGQRPSVRTLMRGKEVD